MQVRARASSLTMDRRIGGWWLGRKWTWVAMGGAAVLAAGAVSAGLLMQSQYDDLYRSCGQGSLARQGCSQSDFDSLNLRRDIANGLWIGSGVAVVTAGILFYVEGRKVTLAPLAGPAVGAQARVGF